MSSRGTWPVHHPCTYVASVLAVLGYAHNVYNVMQMQYTHVFMWIHAYEHKQYKHLYGYILMYDHYLTYVYLSCGYHLNNEMRQASYKYNGI